VAHSNAEVSEYLTNIATAYEIKAKTKFQIVAYQNAADTVLTYPESLFDLWRKDPQLLDSIPNIGPSILNKIDYLFKTSQPHPSLKPVFSGIHPAVFTFTKINGVGPIIAHKLTQHLRFSRSPDKALDQLVKFCQSGTVKIIPTFGDKSEQLILDNTLSFLGRKNRMPLATAQKLSQNIITYMKAEFPNVEFIPLGSLRRESPSVGDIDIAAASTNPKPILDYFINYPDSVQTNARGKNKASLRLLHDVHVDLMVKPPSIFGALIQHFTGSRQHNILLRKHALKLGFSVSEYGIKDLKTGIIHRFDNETSFYRFLGLKFIPPVMRVGESELNTYKVLSQDKK
jgi:DNA polymerase (family 10)